MGHLADLVTVASEALHGLLADEASTVWREASWQFSPLPLPLPGLAWLEGAKATGYLAIGQNGTTLAVGRLFARRSGDGPERVEQALLDGIVRLASGRPGVERLYGDLLAVSPGTARWLESRWGGQVRTRALMGRTTAPLPAAGLALEPFTRADLPAAAGVLLRAHQHRPEAIPDPLLRNPAGLAGALGRAMDGAVCGRFLPEASFLVRAPRSGAPLGMILATWMGPDQGHVAEIAVEPAAGRHGVGSALVAGTLAALARLGCRKVNLAVDLDNLGAVRFYRRLGFAVHHRYPSLRLAMSRLRSDPAEAWIGLRTD